MPPKAMRIWVRPVIWVVGDGNTKMAQHRVDDFKRVGRGAGARDDRFALSVAIRKTDKIDLISCRRRQSSQSAERTNLDAFVVGAARGLCATDPAMLAASVKELYRLMRRTGAPIQALLDSDCVPRLLELLGDRGQGHGTRCDVASVLANAAMGTAAQSRKLVDAGCISSLLSVLDDPDTRESALGALHNIACDDTAFRDQVIRGIPHILWILANPALNSISTQVGAHRLLAVLCSGKPHPPRDTLMEGVEVFAKSISIANDDIAMLGCYGLGVVAAAGPEYVDAIFERGCVKRMVRMLVIRRNGFRKVIINALTALASGTASQAMGIVEAGVLDMASELVESDVAFIVAGYASLLANIVYGGDGAIDAVCRAGVLFTLIRHLVQHPNNRVKLEILHVINNILHLGQEIHLGIMIQFDICKIICFLLEDADLGIVEMALTVVWRILGFGVNYQNDIETYRGLEHIERLALHSCASISEKAVEILDGHFGHDAQME